jgi:hypothetical protein
MAERVLIGPLVPTGPLVPNQALRFVVWICVTPNPLESREIVRFDFGCETSLVDQGTQPTR